MRKIAKLVFISLIAIALMASCTEASDVSVGFSLTDAPISELSGVTEVNVTVSSVSINESTDGQIADDDGSWKTVAIEPAVTLNLLDLQNGVMEDLGDPLILSGGTQINQIRLGVNTVSVVKNDESIEATIPSANQSGLKIVNAFQIPQSGAVTITIDFDVRKSVIENPSGTFMVKPVLRAVIDNEAGKITGSVPATVVTVYAYTDDTWADSETMAPDADTPAFSSAYTSAHVVTDSLTYTLAFLDAGTYDLFGVDATGTKVASLDNVIVNAEATTSSQALVATTP